MKLFHNFEKYGQKPQLSVKNTEQSYATLCNYPQHFAICYNNVVFSIFPTIFNILQIWESQLNLRFFKFRPILFLGIPKFLLCFFVTNFVNTKVLERSWYFLVSVSVASSLSFTPYNKNIFK